MLKIALHFLDGSIIYLQDVDGKPFLYKNEADATHQINCLKASAGPYHDSEPTNFEYVIEP